MDHEEVKGYLATEPVGETARATLTSALSPPLFPQACPSCGTAPSPEPTRRPVSITFTPSAELKLVSRALQIEKEFAQATGRAETAGLTDRQAIQKVLSQRQNRYLARQLCWVMTIEGLETYILVPRDPGDMELLMEAMRPAPNPWIWIASSESADLSLQSRCAMG